MQWSFIESLKIIDGKKYACQYLALGFVLLIFDWMIVCFDVKGSYDCFNNALIYDFNNFLKLHKKLPPN
jgi:hypothetical protein